MAGIISAISMGQQILPTPAGGSSRFDDWRVLAGLCAALAIVPRLPLVARFPGNDISLAVLATGQRWVTTGQWQPVRSPGSPVYEYAVGVLSQAVRGSPTPPFVFANALSVLCVAVSLFLLYRIFREGLSPLRSAIGIVVFDLYPHELVMGAATTDMNFLLLFGIAAVFAVVRRRPVLALVLSSLAVGSRIQGLALALPLLAALMGREWRAKRTGRLLLWPALALLLACLVFYPSYRCFGPSLFVQPYHHGEFTTSQVIGAFLLRSGNMLGPVGMAIVLLVVLGASRRIVRECTETGFIAIGVAALTLCVFAVAPWETFYLLPIAPIAIFAVLRYAGSPAVAALFCASALLPNFTQVQIRPWRMPPVVVRGGVIAAHMRGDWNTRGGG